MIDLYDDLVSIYIIFHWTRIYEGAHEIQNRIYHHVELHFLMKIIALENDLICRMTCFIFLIRSASLLIGNDLRMSDQWQIAAARVSGR